MAALVRHRQGLPRGDQQTDGPAVHSCPGTALWLNHRSIGQDGASRIRAESSASRHSVWGLESVSVTRMFERQGTSRIDQETTPRR
jgi:hypothetical protein